MSDTCHICGASDKPIIGVPVCHDCERLVAAKNAKIAALKADNDKLCAENHDLREEFALENIALTKQLATARECLREAMSKCAAMHYRRGMNPQDDPDYAKWKAAIGGEG